VGEVVERPVPWPFFQAPGEDRDGGAVAHELECVDRADPVSKIRGHRARSALDLGIALPPEAEEKIELEQHLRTGSGEVERERRHVAAQIVHPEHHRLGERVLVAPDDPAQARIDQAVLVPRRVDRCDPGHPEVPDEVFVEEGSDHAAGRRIHMDRHIEAPSPLDLVQRGGDLADRLVGTGIRHAEDRDDADGVLVHVVAQERPVEHRVLGADRHETGLHLEVVA
ncbi:hypothetical protein ABE10_01190, partial [Bacillus toyonensis]|nr:hypothetical protein [Bacillus toyonensis]